MTEFRTRGFVSLLTFAGFLIMSISGLVLYITPEGRVAYWIHWKLLALSKTAWGDIHIISSIVFMAGGLWHLYFNWGSFAGYLTKKVKGSLSYGREMALVGLISVLIVVSGIWKLPPVYWLSEMSKMARGAWVTNPDYEPPFGHAELLSFKVLAQKTEIDPAAALEAVRGAGMEVADPMLSLEEIARRNGVSPLDIYRLMEPHRREPPPLKEAPTPEEVELRYGGTGIGQKALETVAKEAGVETGRAMARLRAQAIEAEPGDKLKEAGEKNALNPLEILKVMLIDGYEISRSEN